MELHTTAEVISFTKKLENDSAEFYKGLSKKSDVLSSFVQENKSFVVQIERSYYSVISDAIEGCFAFEINPADYDIESLLVEKTSNAINKAINLEQKIAQFYTEAAKQSKSLMADVPATFIQIAKKRANRIDKLKPLIENWKEEC